MTDDLTGLEEAFGSQTLEDKGKGRAVDDDTVDFQRLNNFVPGCLAKR